MGPGQGEPASNFLESAPNSSVSATTVRGVIVPNIERSLRFSITIERTRANLIMPQILLLLLLVFER
jgi:hypothetical protein